RPDRLQYLPGLYREAGGAQTPATDRGRLCHASPGARQDPASGRGVEQLQDRVHPGAGGALAERENAAVLCALGRGLGREEELGQMEDQPRLREVPLRLYRPSGPFQSDLVPQHQDQKTITTKSSVWTKENLSKKAGWAPWASYWPLPC